MWADERPFPTGPSTLRLLCLSWTGHPGFPAARSASASLRALDDAGVELLACVTCEPVVHELFGQCVVGREGANWRSLALPGVLRGWGRVPRRPRRARGRAVSSAFVVATALALPL